MGLGLRNSPAVRNSTPRKSGINIEHSLCEQSDELVPITPPGQKNTVRLIQIDSATSPGEFGGQLG